MRKSFHFKFINLTLCAAFATSFAPASQGADKSLAAICQSALQRSFLGLGRAVLRTRYQSTVKGAEVFEGVNQGVLVLANHPGLIDPPILMTELNRHLELRPLMKEKMARNPLSKAAATAVRAVLIPDVEQEGPNGVAAAEAAIESVIGSLRRGENVLLYPSGKIYRSYLERIGANSGVERILKALPKTRVVLARTKGLWGSSFGFGATGEDPGKDLLKKTLPRAFFSIVSGGLFFAPKRQVEIELSEPSDLPRDQGKMVLNRYLENHFNENAPKATRVPYYWWQGATPKEIAEHQRSRGSNDLPSSDTVSAETRAAIYEFIKEKTGAEPRSDRDQLEADLGMDSLSRVEMLVWIGTHFGREVPESSELKTVGDVLLAAEGHIASTGNVELKAVNKRWFQNKDADAVLEIPEGKSVPEVFLAQARRYPNRAAIADQISGVLSYRDLVHRIFALTPLIEKLAGDSDYVGIMMPASATATALVLAAQFAGKTPVMINFTAGQSNLEHAAKASGIKTILTSQALVEKLKGAGMSFGELENMFFKMESLKEDAAFKANFVKAKINSYGPWWLLDRWTKRVREESVVLFTSGSERNPKGVPLTHANQLQNIRDVAQMASFKQRDRLLGFLPAFHSFGLTVTQVMSLSMGLPTVYYPNPLDGKALADHVQAYQATLVPGTPTFLNGIARASAENPEALSSIRLWVTGAEKCSDAVYEALNLVCPTAIVSEGYGITETSPVAAINPPDAPRKGSLGKIVPSLEYAIVDIETRSQRVAKGERGLLLLKGPSVFGGYLSPSDGNPFVNFESQSWYNTGDLVSESADGYLSMQGRLKRFEKIAGEMVSLPAIEEALLTRFQRSEDKSQVLAVESRRDGDKVKLVLLSTKEVTVAEANEIIRSAGLNGLHFISEVRAVKELPLLGSGKLDYPSIKKLLLETP